MNKIQLEKLNAMVKDRKNIIVTAETRGAQENVEHWNSSGRPYLWLKVEDAVCGIFTVYKDLTCGYLLLFKNNEIIGKGTDSVITDEVIVLDKDYYSCSKYIWV